MRLALHNIKKTKSQFVSFGIMILITALIMNIALVLNSQTSGAYDQVFANLDTAEINVMVPAFFASDELADDLLDLAGVEKTERHEGVLVTATVHEFAGSDFDMNTVFYNIEEKRNINRLEVDGAIKNVENLIYVPKYITQLGQFALDDRIVYQVGDTEYTYTIGGAVSEMQYGNYGTGLIGAYLPQSAYEKFVDENAEKEIVEYSLKVKSGADLVQIKKDITALLSDKNIPLAGLGDRDTAKQTRTMVCNLLIMIFLALSAIILLVSLFLSSFRIRNNMEDEMTNMGVLKAIGYTSNEIIIGAVTPYTLVGSLCAALGVALSYLLLPGVAGFLAMQSGFSYTPVFDLTALLLTVLIPVVLIFVFSLYSARKIRKLEPIWAIRGITGTEVGKNHFPLAETKTGVKFTIILKQIVASPAQNVLLFVLSFGIMILLSFAGTLFYNINIKPDNFMDTLSEESPSVIFTAKEGKRDELKECLKKDGKVKQVIEYATLPVSFPDGSLTCFVCEDFSLVTNDICYEGSNPSKDDEIAVGSALAEKYGIGNRIKITNGEESYSYTVTGFVQSVNNSGNVCELTRNGFARISETEPSSLNVYLEKGEAEGFIEKWEKNHDDLILTSLNYEKLKESGQKMYAGIVSAVTALLFVISILVVLLVMYIIIGSMVTRRRQEFGIYKAIGWSNSQLVTQSAMCFVPVIAVSAVLSAFAGVFYMPAIDRAIFGMLGAMKNHFEVSVWFLLLFAALFVAVSYVISVILAAPIKKITAYSLLKE